MQRIVRRQVVMVIMVMVQNANRYTRKDFGGRCYPAMFTSRGPIEYEYFVQELVMDLSIIFCEYTALFRF